MAHHPTESVAILDAGAQYSKVIDRKVRELNVHTDMLPLDVTPKLLIEKGVKAIIISGGPDSVYTSSIKYDPEILNIGLPVLGICFGMQMIAHCTGGKVEKKSEREDGQFEITVSPEDPLFDSMAPSQKVLLTHGDSVVALGDGYQVTGRSGTLISAISNPQKNIFGVQFHPEVDLTVNGKQLFKNFLFKISGFSGNFNLGSRQEDAIKEIQSTVGEKKVLMMASGGVDSTVCCALLHKALGKDRVIALHIDNGFMRKNESSKVATALRAIGLDLIVVDASKEFYDGKTTIEGGETLSLKESFTPEHKRKIIGDTFVRIAQREIEKLGLDPKEVFLAQGTLRPDMIESGSLDISKHAHVIKTHHNDTALVRELRALGRVIEPLKDYHKDEVRELGKDLGLPTPLVARHPFPGPGLSVRIICALEPFIDNTFSETNKLLEQVTNGNAHVELEDTIKQALRTDEIAVLNEIRKQANIVPTLLPFKTVGVQGDGRTYSYPCLLTTKDHTPNWTQLFALARFIPRLSHNVNRVVYMFGDAIQGPVLNITPTLCTTDVIKTLQEADDIVTEIFEKTNQLKCVAQVPVIIFPYGSNNKRSIALRPIITTDFMTGQAAIPGQDLTVESIVEIATRVTKVDGVDRFAYDLTSKPPGTTEWE